MELVSLENRLHEEGRIAKPSGMKEKLREAVITSKRWTKWIHKDESPADFNALKPDRQLWLIKTGCRYIWENPEIVAARSRLYVHMERNGIHAETVVLTAIGQAMDRYFHKFNLVNVSDLL
jgi:hypothetical protein